MSRSAVRRCHRTIHCTVNFLSHWSIDLKKLHIASIQTFLTTELANRARVSAHPPVMGKFLAPSLL